MTKRQGFLAVLLAAASATALAQGRPGQRVTPERIRPSAGSSAAEAQQLLKNQIAGRQPLDFGTSSYYILQIPAAAFKPLCSSDGYVHDYNGYVHMTSNTCDLWAPVQLPSGIALSYMDLYFNDTNAATDLQAYLVGFTGGKPADSGASGETIIGSVFSFGSAGEDYNSTGLSYTVNNDVAFDVNGAQLAIEIYFPATDGSLKFKSVDIWYQRQVSPDPAFATFADVPVGHPQHRFVEALYAAGITAGCGGGNYCPDSPLTRGQMAVFLSAALGLQWPY